MTLNGIHKEIDKSYTVLSMLKAENYNPGRVAVLLNGQIVPRDAFGTTEIKNSDTLEVVSFVGGG